MVVGAATCACLFVGVLTYPITLEDSGYKLNDWKLMETSKYSSFNLEGL